MRNLNFITLDYICNKPLGRDFLSLNSDSNHELLRMYMVLKHTVFGSKYPTKVDLGIVCMISMARMFARVKTI